MTQPYQYTYQKIPRQKRNRPYNQTYGEYPELYPRIPSRASKRQNEVLTKSGDMEPETEDFEYVPEQKTTKIKHVSAERIPVQTKEFQKNSFITRMIIGGCITVAAIFAVLTIADWSTNTWNDWKYGTPRSSHLFATVGHGDAEKQSFFIANNLNNQISIIECPASDCSKAVSIVGPFLSDSKQVITLSFKDLGNGYPDMLIHAGNQEFVIMNSGKKFDTTIKPTQEEMNKIKE